MSEVLAHPFGTILSDAHLAALQSRFPRVAHAVAGGEKWLGTAMGVIEVAGIAGVMSYFNAKHGQGPRPAVEILGVPADLVFGLLITGGSAMGYFGEHARHSQNIGAGLISAYSSRMGTDWGRGARMPEMPAGVRGYFGAPQPPAMPQAPYYPPQQQQQRSQQFSWETFNQQAA